MNDSSGRALATVWQNYRPPPDCWDELFEAPGRPRAHWRPFLQALDELGPDEIGRRQEQAQRMVAENGISYSAQWDPADVSRPWQIDAIPLIIEAGEWKRIAAGLEQRAALLNALAHDLYAERRTLTERLIPLELLFTHPGYRMPFHGLPAPGGSRLILYAADLARTADGSWCVVADRTTAPSGAAYALENRLATSGVWPEQFHNHRVDRLAPFFIALRETLRRLAPRHRDPARIVLLSQGINSPFYFEDAYLAKYLGYPLVEGGDLAVRSEHVMLKTLGGLLPVDVVLRRINDSDVDPLECGGNSPFGVAGMLQAIRSGSVSFFNAPGCGVLESPAFMTFLPELCRFLLGEELRLPSVPTWWCGNREHLAYVLRHLDRLLVKPAIRFDGRRSLFEDRRHRTSESRLAEEIRRRPGQFVAQEVAQRSSTPVWMPHGLEPWQMMLRAYVVATERGYLAMPGGLLRVSPLADSPEGTRGARERSQDAWVLSEAPVQYVTLLQPPGQAVELRRTGAELSSRVADDLFWLGRIAERTEGAARLVRTVAGRMASEARSPAEADLQPLLRCLAAQGLIEPGFVVEGIRDSLPLLERAMPAGVFNEQDANSLRSMLISLHRTASQVRDRLSIDSWRVIVRMLHEFVPPAGRGRPDLGGLLVALNQVLINLAALGGMVMESMTRTPGWRFLDLGRRIERALHLLDVVGSLIGGSDETATEEANSDGNGLPSLAAAGESTAGLDAVLEVLDCSITYRTRYLATLQWAPVLDLVITDETNPRSLASQLVAIYEHVEQLPRDRARPLRSPEQRLALRMLTRIRTADIERLSRRRTRGGALDRMLRGLQQSLPRLADEIVQRYLVHAGSPRQLEEIRPERRASQDGKRS